MPCKTKRGWFGEPGRHALAAKGIRTNVPRKSGRAPVMSDSKARLLNKVREWVANTIDWHEKNVQELEDLLDVEATYSDTGYSGEIEIEIWSKDGSKYLSTVRSISYGFLDEQIANGVGISEKKARELLKDEAFVDMLGNGLYHIECLGHVEDVLLDLRAGNISFDEGEE